MESVYNEKNICIISDLRFDARHVRFVLPCGPLGVDRGRNRAGAVDE